MSDLVEFLRARLDEDEHVARQALEWWGSDREAGCFDWPSREASAHALHHDPARMLREVEAKRRILGIHTGGHECASYDFTSREISNGVWVVEGEDCTTVRLLALPYADQPDYRDTWRPA